MAELVNKDRDKEDRNPRNDQIDTIQGKPEENRNQQKRWPDFDGDPGKFESQEDPIMAQLGRDVSTRAGNPNRSVSVYIRRSVAGFKW
jgi:hypothetical protein